MHYLFERRLNMVDVALNSLTEEEILEEDREQKLLEEHRIAIPQLEWEKASYDIKKTRLTSDNAPPDFHIHHGHEYTYLECSIPFSDPGFIEDIFTLSSKAEGLSIKPDSLVYREYSHDPIEKGNAEYERIKANVHKAAAAVEMRLDEFAADAVEFNQVFLPAAVQQKLAAEKVRRLARIAEGAG